MDAAHYPPLNVLCITRGYADPKIKYHLTPYRIEKLTGEVFRVKQVRQCVWHRKGKTLQYQYTVSTKEGPYLEIWFDGHTLTWRITKERSVDGIILEY